MRQLCWSGVGDPWAGALPTKMCSANTQVSADTSQGFRGCLSVILTLIFTEILIKIIIPPPPPGVTQPIVGVYFTALYRALASSSKRLLHHKQRRATVGRTPLKE